MIIASYLQIWLSSLFVSQSLDIQEALRLAMTLEQLQPSIAALTKAYFSDFPEIVERRPNFLRRVVQFSGLALIQQIQAIIQYQNPLTIQVSACSRLPNFIVSSEQSLLTVFWNGRISTHLSQSFSCLSIFSCTPTLMQLLDSLQNQLPASALDRVLNSLQDIVRNVQIQSNFCISHPAYKPFELPGGGSPLSASTSRPSK